MISRSGATAAATAAMLVASLSGVVAAQSSAPTVDGQRVEADFFSVTFPTGWDVEVTTDDSAGQGVAANLDDPRTLCTVAVGLDPFTPEEKMRSLTAAIEADPAVTLLDSGVIDPPAGPTLRVMFLNHFEDTDDTVTTEMFSIQRGGLAAIVNCSGPERSDKWRAIAESVEWLTLDEDVELGWPDVPLAEQQSWARIGPSAAVARHQIAHIGQTYSLEMPWYIQCMDRAHEAIDIGEGGWEESRVLRVIEAGSACWATRNHDSTDWDYSDWTTPAEALQERLLHQWDKSYRWLCVDVSDVGLGLTYYTDDAMPPEEMRALPPEQCILIRGPLVGATGAGAADEGVRLPVSRSSEDDGLLMFPLSGAYDVVTEGTNCKGVQFVLMNNQAERFSMDIGARERQDFEPSGWWIAVDPDKMGKKPCTWRVTLTPVGEEGQ